MIKSWKYIVPCSACLSRSLASRQWQVCHLAFRSLQLTGFVPLRIFPSILILTLKPSPHPLWIFQLGCLPCIKERPPQACIFPYPSKWMNLVSWNFIVFCWLLLMLICASSTEVFMCVSVMRARNRNTTTIVLWGTHLCTLLGSTVVGFRPIVTSRFCRLF